VTEEALRASGTILRRASGILGWAALGEFVGHFVGLGIPDAWVSDTMLGHAVAVLMVILGTIGMWIRPTADDDESVRGRLTRVDLLFLRGTITDDERGRLRQQILRGLIAG